MNIVPVHAFIYVERMRVRRGYRYDVGVDDDNLGRLNGHSGVARNRRTRSPFLNSTNIIALISKRRVKTSKVKGKITKIPAKFTHIQFYAWDGFATIALR